MVKKLVLSPLLPSAPVNLPSVSATFTCTGPYGISRVVIEDDEGVPNVDGDEFPADDARAVAVYIFYNHREAEI